MFSEVILYSSNESAMTITDLPGYCQMDLDHDILQVI